MSKVWMVHKDSLELIRCVESDDTARWLINSEIAEWVEVPEELESYACGAVLVDGVITLIASSAKTGPQWSRLRASRDVKLISCDWTQMSDSPLSNEVKQDWATYRQALRDLPANTEDPNNITWPEQP